MYDKPITEEPLSQPIYGDYPVRVNCVYCQSHVITMTTLEDGNLTYTASALLCLAGCWFGCCLIPFFMDSCKDVIHSCPNCRAPLGKFNKLC